MSEFWQRWTKLLRTSMCKLLCRPKFSNLLRKHQEVWLLDHMIRVCLVSQETTKLSPKVAAPSALSPQWVRFPTVSQPPQHLMLSSFQILAILAGRAVTPHCRSSWHLSDDLWCRGSRSCLFVVCASSLVRRLLRYWARFLIQLFPCLEF